MHEFGYTLNQLLSLFLHVLHVPHLVLRVNLWFSNLARHVHLDQKAATKQDGESHEVTVGRAVESKGRVLQLEWYSRARDRPWLRGLHAGEGSPEGCSGVSCTEAVKLPDGLF